MELENIENEIYKKGYIYNKAINKYLKSNGDNTTTVLSISVDNDYNYSISEKVVPDSEVYNY